MVIASQICGYPKQLIFTLKGNFIVLIYSFRRRGKEGGEGQGRTDHREGYFPATKHDILLPKLVNIITHHFTHMQTHVTGRALLPAEFK